MPSESTTPLGLSQWLGSERPKREDFNRDNEKIDLACRSALQGLAQHIGSDAHPAAEQIEHWSRAAHHTGESVATAQGLHGLRFWAGQLEVKVEGVWQPCGNAATGPQHHVYGVCIDLGEPDPQAAVTYTDDAVGMQPGAAAWQNTFLGRIKPCLLRQGQVVCYLDPQDYTRAESGEPVDITSGDAGDVMVEIPRMAYAIYAEGAYLHVRVTDHPEAAEIDPRFCYLAHTRGSEGDRQNLYVGAYLGHVQQGQLRSLSGHPISTGYSLRQFRAMARAGADGYDALSFYPLTLLQCLVLIRGGTRNTQSALGRGYVQDTTDTAATGGTNATGLFSGDETGALQMKAFGIEDLWGNCYCLLEGLRADDAGMLQTATQSFDHPQAWRSTGRGAPVDTGYITQIHGDNLLGFAPTQTGGSGSTWWCDYGSVLPGCIPLVGGYHYSRLQAGAFLNHMQMQEHESGQTQCARLMYL